MNKRQFFGRLRAGRCTRHNSAVTPSSHFDGGTCSLGCEQLNVARFHALGMTRSERAERCKS